MAIDPNSMTRITESTKIRNDLAAQDAAPANPTQNPNNDEARPDKLGTYSKGLKQIPDKPGFVEPAAYAAFRAAISQPDFAKGIHYMPDNILGGGAKLNGPQGAFAFQLDCLDSAQFGSDTVP